jgi:hypothetical protein
MIRKSIEYDNDVFLGIYPFVLGLLENSLIYCIFHITNPKLIPYVIGAQLSTNAISLGYELAKHAKKVAEERIKEGLPPDRFGY